MATAFVGAGLGLLVPRHRALAEAGDDARDPPPEIFLDVAAGGEALLALQPIDLGQVVPRALANLVAAEVEIGAGEQPGDLAQHRPDEIVGLGLAGVEAAFLVEKLGIGPRFRARMAGHLDLRHDDDVPLARVSDDLADVGGGEILPLAGRGVERADLGQLRVAGDFEPPAGIVGQVQLQHVQLVARHLVDELEHLGLAEEVAADVDQQPTPGETRSVGDGGRGDRAFAVVVDDQLAKGLRPVEQALGVGRLDDRAFGRDAETVGLGVRALGGGDEAEPDPAL